MGAACGWAVQRERTKVRTRIRNTCLLQRRPDPLGTRTPALGPRVPFSAPEQPGQSETKSAAASRPLPPRASKVTRLASLEAKSCGCCRAKVVVTQREVCPGCGCLSGLVRDGCLLGLLRVEGARQAVVHIPEGASPRPVYVVSACRRPFGASSAEAVFGELREAKRSRRPAQPVARSVPQPYGGTMSAGLAGRRP